MQYMFMYLFTQKIIINNLASKALLQYAAYITWGMKSAKYELLLEYNRNDHLYTSSPQNNNHNKLLGQI